MFPLALLGVATLASGWFVVTAISDWSQFSSWYHFGLCFIGVRKKLTKLFYVQTKRGKCFCSDWPKKTKQNHQHFTVVNKIIVSHTKMFWWEQKHGQYK